jgi:hypothetical protein
MLEIVMQICMKQIVADPTCIALFELFWMKSEGRSTPHLLDCIGATKHLLLSYK